MSKIIGKEIVNSPNKYRETEGIKVRSYGIDVTQTSFKPLMEELGLEKSVNELTQAEKEILRYISTLRQAKNAMGDFANTINSPANQLKVLKQQFYEMQAAIGTLFVGAFARILPYVNAIVMVIKYLARTIASFFGIKMKDYNSKLASYADDIDDYSESLDGVGGSADSAAESLKKLNRQVLAFDQINNLVSPTPTSSSGSGGGGASLGEIDDKLLAALKEYNNGMYLVTMRANEIRDIIMQWLGFTKEINEETHEISYSYNTAGKTISQIAREVAFNLANMLNYYTRKIEWDKLGGYLAEGINTAFGFLDTFVQTYDWKNLGNSIATFLNNAIKSVDAATLGRAFTDKLRIAIKTLAGFLEKFDFGEFGRKLAEFINSAIENIPIEDIAKGLNKLADGIQTGLWNLITNIKWGELFDNLFELISSLDWDTKFLLLAPIIAKALGGLFGSSIVKEIIGSKIKEAILGGSTGGGIGLSAAELGKSLGITGTIVLGVYLQIEGYSTTNTIVQNMLEGKKNKALFEGVITEDSSLWDVALKAAATVNHLLSPLSMISFSKWQLDIIEKIFGIGKTSDIVTKEIKENAQQYMDAMIETDKQQRILKASTEGNYEEIARIVAESTEESTAHVKDSLVEQTKAVEGDLGKELLQQWAILAYSSEENYKNGIKSLPDDLADQIQAATNTMVKVTPTVVQHFLDLGEQSESKLIEALKKLPPDLQQEVIDKMKEKGAKIPEEIQKGIDSVDTPTVTVESDDSSAKTTADNTVTYIDSKNACIKVDADMSNANNTVSWWKRGLNAVFGLNLKADGGVFANGRWQPIQAYANGGIPSGGQLFMAREAGPELVGKIGNHTAVMNNNQIVDSVKAGVYEAVTAAMSNSGMGSVQIDLHTDEGVVVDRINRITRQTGTCPIDI